MSLAPSSRSTPAMWAERVCCVTCSCSAAFVKLLCSAMARKYSMVWKFMLGLPGWDQTNPSPLVPLVPQIEIVAITNSNSLKS